MTPQGFLILLTLLCSSHHLSAIRHVSDGDDDSPLEAYLVIVRRADGMATAEEEEVVEDWHVSLIAQVCNTSDPETAQYPTPASRLIYSYSHVVSGFSAWLTSQEVEEMATYSWFVEAIPEKKYKLMTTNTPHFLGLNSVQSGVWNKGNMGEGMIIGVLDTGIAAGHLSFSPQGMPPPPAMWKGKCDYSGLCNNKLIGLRSFMDTSPPLGLDKFVGRGGHGTHAASIAAGNFVHRASVLGTVYGTASGMAPKAHLAFYHVCNEECEPDAIKAGMDAAINDGVDVISMSMGSDGDSVFDDDPVMMRSYRAVSQGVFVCASAGNSGPGMFKVENHAPWLLTVAASDTDRRVVANVKLGNGLVIDGESIKQAPTFSQTMVPLVYVEDVLSPGAMDGGKVRGKIVFCQEGESKSIVKKSQAALNAGAKGVIIWNRDFLGYTIGCKELALPGTQVSFADGEKIVAYINSSTNPTATIDFKGVVINPKSSIAISGFTSHGPSRHNGGILKPDISAPGVNILAALPQEDADGTEAQSSGAPKFGFKMGTSMAAPHISGIAALISKAHPEWSPAALKSALITTADPLGRDMKPIKDDSTSERASYYAMGAGEVNPVKAMNPGLVYNLTAKDFIPYLCGMGFGDSRIGKIIEPEEASCAVTGRIAAKDLNYPSIMIILEDNVQQLEAERTVTNVGEPAEKYRAEATASGVDVVVTPATLEFNSTNQTMDFVVTVKRQPNTPAKAVIEGELKWVSDKHVVRSPVVVVVGETVASYTNIVVG